MSRTSQTTVRDATRGPARKVAGAVGVLFLIVGVLGFIPGVTTQYHTLAWAGPDSHAQLLGLFRVSALHNIVHLAFGAAGLAAALLPVAARAYLIGGGVVYLALWIYGIIVAPGSAANFVPVDAPDNWLHLFLGLGMIAAGFVVKRGRGQAP